MDVIDTIMTLEEGANSELEYAKSVQSAINAGLWGLQGSYGRLMMNYIESGVCLLGHKGCHDYYGNYIPSRDEVQAGTKGSYEFVAAHTGEVWAKAMVEVTG